MKIYYAWSFFLIMTAYLPLFLILVLLNWSGSLRLFNPSQLMEWISMLGLLVSVISAIIVNLLVATAVKEEHGAGSRVIRSITARDKDVLGYLVSYIIPLVTIRSTTWLGACAFILIIILVIWLSLETDMRYINPVMFARGFHFYNVKSNQTEWLLISHAKTSVIKEHPERWCVRISGHDVLIDRGLQNAK